MDCSLDEQNNVTTAENTSNPTGLSNGSHNLKAYAIDAAGNFPICEIRVKFW